MFSPDQRLYRKPGLPTGYVPGVSVLIPARNEELGIGSAVAAALACTGVELEVIVLDDHSTDRTRVCVEEIARTDGRTT